MTREIALSLTRYDTPEKLSTLPYDTASLAIEASSNENLPRVNPTYLVLNKEKVIAPGKDKRDVSEMFVADDSSETKAGLNIVKELKNNSEDFIYIWISPSGPYPESRIQVGVKKTTKSGRYNYIKRYDISTTLSSEKCLLTGQFLISLSNEKVDFPQTSEELRKTIIKLKTPDNQNPFEYLSKIIELPEKDRWKSILDGTADKNKATAVKAAVTVTKPIMERPYLIYENPVYYGAYVENQMKMEGFGMDPKRFGCGGSNTTFTSTNLSFTETSTPFFGSEDQYGSLEFPCPHCGAVNKRPFGQLISNCWRCSGDVRC